MLDYLIAWTDRLRFGVAKNLPFLIPNKKGGIHHLLITVALLSFAVWLRLKIAPINIGLQYLTFYPAVTLAAIVGGFEAGVFAAIVGVACATFIFTPPYYSFSLEAVKTTFWSNSVFLMDSIIVSFCIEAMHRYREKCTLQLKQTVDMHSALEQSMQYVTKIIDNLFSYVALLDNDGVVQEVNKAPLERAGYHREEVIGHYFYDAPWWNYDENVRDQLIEAIDAAKQGYTLRYDVIVKMGDEFVPIDFQISPVRDDDGNIIGLLPTGVDITLRKKAEEEVRILAFYDALTKLANRRLLLDRLQQALVSSERNRNFGAVLFLDMDKFKKINDLNGHDHGDLMLIDVAERIKRCVREVDTVARFGGDEFVVLFEDFGQNEEGASQRAALIAEKIRASLAVPFQINGQLHHSSPSIGVCLYKGQSVSVDDLIKHADIAMFRAKNEGRNTVRFYDPNLQQLLEKRAALEADLSQALSSQQLHLYYQIQYEKENHRPMAAEALIRWIHPKLGMILPVQFMSIAEESSLILEIGQWILETACRQLEKWKTNPATRHLMLAVNISSQQFMMHDFVESIQTALGTYGIEPSQLKLELTEKVILNDIEDSMVKLKALKALGISLALDEFGTGYSSLAYLKKLPIDQVKIDPCFMQNLGSDLDDGMMVKTIIDMAKNFSINVIAEGVETETQTAFLEKYGCLAYQGYLYGKPMPIDQFDELVKHIS